MKRTYLLTGIVAALALVVISGVAVYRNSDAREANQLATNNLQYLVREHSPRLGNPAAPVHIVEFMDPACSTCKSFYPLVKQMLKSHPEQIRLSVRHVGLHPGSDYVVRVLEASREQGKYWQTLDALLTGQDAWVINHRAQPDLIWGSLRDVGLDMARLQKDVYSPQVEQRIAQDMSDAKALRVVATPEFFVNGKPLPSFGYEELNTLVQSALASAS